jgi:hypothetical protein
MCTHLLLLLLLLPLLDLALLWRPAPGDFTNVKDHFTYVSCDWTISDNPTLYNYSGKLDYH